MYSKVVQMIFFNICNKISKLSFLKLAISISKKFELGETKTQQINQFQKNSNWCAKLQIINWVLLIFTDIAGILSHLGVISLSHYMYDQIEYNWFSVVYRRVWHLSESEEIGPKGHNQQNSVNLPHIHTIWTDRPKSKKLINNGLNNFKRIYALLE